MPVTRLEDRPWWPELLELKDALSLRELAARYGVSPAAISNALKRNGIARRPAPSGPRGRRPEAVRRAAEEALARVGPPPRLPETRAEAHRGRLAPYRHLIGKLVDREVAELAGVSTSAVTNHRRRHGIPPARRPRGAAVLHVPSAGSEGPVPGRAYRVSIGGRDYVIVAADILEAARLAVESGRGEVTRIEMLAAAAA